MTPKQEKYLTEKYIRPMVKKMLRESKYPGIEKKIKEVIADLQILENLVETDSLKKDPNDIMRNLNEIYNLIYKCL